MHVCLSHSCDCRSAWNALKIHVSVTRPGAKVGQISHQRAEQKLLCTSFWIQSTESTEESMGNRRRGFRPELWGGFAEKWLNQECWGKRRPCCSASKQDKFHNRTGRKLTDDSILGCCLSHLRFTLAYSLTRRKQQFGMTSDDFVLSGFQKAD